MRIQLIEREAKQETAPGASSTATAPCPSCEQLLVVPTQDLCRTYRCPRCQADHLAGDVIAFSTPIPAIAVGDAPAPRMNPWARTLTMPRAGAAPRAALPRNDVARPTNPWSSTMIMPRVRAAGSTAPASDERVRTPLWRSAALPRPAAAAQLRARVDALLAAAEPRVRAGAARLESAGRVAFEWAVVARARLSALRVAFVARTRRLTAGSSQPPRLG